jgi:hypothetical protein
VVFVRAESGAANVQSVVVITAQLGPVIMYQYYRIAIMVVIGAMSSEPCGKEGYSKPETPEMELPKSIE